MVTLKTQPMNDRQDRGEPQQHELARRPSRSKSPYLDESFVLLGAAMANKNHRRAGSIERMDIDSVSDTPAVIEATESEVDRPELAPAAPSNRKVRNLQLLLATAAITAVIASACAVHFQRQSAAYQSLYEITATELARVREQAVPSAPQQEPVADCEPGVIFNSCWMVLKLGECGQQFFAPFTEVAYDIASGLQYVATGTVHRVTEEVSNGGMTLIHWTNRFLHESARLAGF